MLTLIFKIVSGGQIGRFGSASVPKTANRVQTRFLANKNLTPISICTHTHKDKLLDVQMFPRT